MKITKNLPFSITKIVGLILLALTLVALFGVVIQKLWNGIMPNVFGLSEITYLQAFGLLLLSRILIGGFGNDKSHNSSDKWNTKKYGPVTVETKA